MQVACKPPETTGHIVHDASLTWATLQSVEAAGLVVTTERQHLVQ